MARVKTAYTESFNCLPTTGRLPEKENEVAVSSLVLEALGVTPKIGEEVTLTWEVNPMLKQYKTDTFQICGFSSDIQVPMHDGRKHQDPPH